MVVDPDSRISMANAIEQYLECRIDNFVLDNVLSDLATAEDEACKAIAEEMWHYYDDCRKHRNESTFKLSATSEETVRRWILSLSCKTEWRWERPRPFPTRGILSWIVNRASDALQWRHCVSTENRFWPWASEEEWRLWYDSQLGDSNLKTRASGTGEPGSGA